MISNAGNPGSLKPAAAGEVKSRQPRGVVFVPLRRGSQSRIADAAILDSDRKVAEILYKI